MINCKGCGKNRARIISTYEPCILLEEQRKTTEHFSHNKCSPACQRLKLDCYKI